MRVELGLRCILVEGTLGEVGIRVRVKLGVGCNLGQGEFWVRVELGLGCILG